MISAQYIERKLYALLISQGLTPSDYLPSLAYLNEWWQTQGQIAQQLTDTSDCLFFQQQNPLPTNGQISHPITGAKQNLQPRAEFASDAILHLKEIWRALENEPHGLEQFYLYCWRFLPDRLNRSYALSKTEKYANRRSR